MSIVSHGFGVLVHPVATFNSIKENRDKFNYKWSLLLIFLLFPVKILSASFSHYPFKSIYFGNVSVLYQVYMIYFLIISYILINFAVTSISNGETQFKEIIYGISLCLMPFLILSLPVAILTRIMCIEEKGIYVFLNTFIIIWIAFLIFTSNVVLNGYTIIKTIKISLVIIFYFIIYLALVASIIILSSHFIEFIRNIINEIRYYYSTWQ